MIEKREALRVTWSRQEKTPDASTVREIKGLTKGDEFYFRVAAINKMGMGEFLEMPRPVTVKSPYGQLIVCACFSHTFPFIHIATIFDLTH
jgi:hypothetical protein